MNPGTAGKHDDMARVAAWILATVALAHVVLLVYGALHPADILLFDRTYERESAARALLAARSPAAALDVLARRGTPGDYAWHAALLGMLGGWLPGVPLLQLGLLALTMLALYHIAMAVDGRPRVAWTAVGLYALLPEDFIVPHFLASEAVFTPLLVLATGLLVRYAMRSSAARHLAGAGVLFGLAALTRPIVVGWLPFMLAGTTLVARRQGRRRAWAHVTLLAACTCAAPLLWMSFVSARTGSLGYSESHHDLGSTLGIRVAEVRRTGAARKPAAALPSAGTRSDSAGSSGSQPEATASEFLRVAREEPRAFARAWLFHTIKFVVLPDNLDVLVYLGAFERTGNRANLVHDIGWFGALQRLWREMPGPVTCLLAGMTLFSCFWVLVVWGALATLRGSAGVHRWICGLLVSLPACFLLARVVEEGSARKRSPVDFVLVLFAALGIESLRRWRSELASKSSSGATRDGG
jgi:4-amino-4-deoxy-L-arabinose transferase-like glycosyltransferase